MIELLVAISIFGLLGCVLISVLGTAGNRDIIILTRMMVFGAAMLKKKCTTVFTDTGILSWQSLKLSVFSMDLLQH